MGPHLPDFSHKAHDFWSCDIPLDKGLELFRRGAEGDKILCLPRIAGLAEERIQVGEAATEEFLLLFEVHCSDFQWSFENVLLIFKCLREYLLVIPARFVAAHIDMDHDRAGVAPHTAALSDDFVF
jgi:hypothetical protein